MSDTLDIVERLLRGVGTGPGWGERTKALGQEAADEITSLRDTVDKFAEEIQALRDEADFALAGTGVLTFGERGQWAVSTDDHCLQFHPQYPEKPELKSAHIWREAFVFICEQGGFDAVVARLRDEPEN